MIAVPIVEESLFKKATPETLSHIRQRITEKKPTFLSSVTPLFAETVQVAFLLNECYNNSDVSKEKKLYKTFFGNSHLEALHGALKIARHASKLLNPEAEGRILIYESNPRLKIYFDPLNKGEKEALIPGVTFNTDIEIACNELIAEDCKLSALVIQLDKGLNSKILDNAFDLCKKKNIISIIDASHVDFEFAFSLIKKLSSRADIIIIGEALTNYEMPFGAFSVADNIYAPWNSPHTCLLHGSTYGGNGLILSAVKNILINAKTSIELSDKAIARLEDFEKNHRKKIQGFKKYLNSSAPVLYSSGKLDINVVQSSGGKLFVNNKSGKSSEIIDCIGGSGCSLRGHNSLDIIEGVLNKHQPKYNYWQDLSLRLNKITEFTHCFPGVSGASAVEIAITLAMTANRGKNKIVVFKGNYAGTSLIALNASDRNNAPFYPLYPEVDMINIYDPRSKDILERLLFSGEVALVWFEAVQGASLFPVPFEILRLVNEYKESKGFLVGVDEILNGTFRTGNFFSFDERLISPDIVTISKAISDMVFPISVAMTKLHVYQKALLNNPGLVIRLEKLYVNQLGAHIALNALEKSITNGIGENVKKMSKLLKAGLKDISRQSSLLKSVGGVGLHLQLNLAMDKYPFKYIGRYWSEVLMTKLCYEEGKVLTFYGRLLPPLNISEIETKNIIKGISKAFGKPKTLILIKGILLKVKTFISSRTTSINDFMDNL